ncbi:MAG: hypothetical protein ABH836_03700 [Candidatus Omnitrophota bacterium]
MKQSVFFIAAIFVFCTICGCETLPPPTPEKIITNPFGTTPLRMGMSKEEVINLWGQPNEVTEKGQDELGTVKEEWTYQARYPVIPVDYNYLSKDKVLIFSGNSLTDWEDKE